MPVPQKLDVDSTVAHLTGVAQHVFMSAVGVDAVVVWQGATAQFVLAAATLKTLPEPQKPAVSAIVEHLTGEAQHVETSALVDVVSP